MAVDKKSDYVGNHDGRYMDMDGQTKQFTYIDHDVKSKLAIPPTQEEYEEAKKGVQDAKTRMINELLELSPTAAPDVFQDFVLRGDRPNVVWNEQMIRDEGLPFQKLRDMLVLTKNRIELYGQGLL